MHICQSKIWSSINKYRHAIKEMNNHSIIYSMYRVNALRTPSRPTPVEGGTIYPDSRPIHGYHTSVLVTMDFSHSLDVCVFSIYLHTIYSHFCTLFFEVLPFTETAAFFCMLFFEVLPFTTLAVSVNGKT